MASIWSLSPKRILVGIVALAMVAILACGSDDPTATPASAASPTAQAGSAATQAPAATQAAATEAPIAFPTPSPTPLPQAQPTATRAPAAQVIGVSGGSVASLNYAYPEVWDPHIAGTLGALASISPLYNQVVEFDPINPSEVIGDLAKSWTVTNGGTTYTFILNDNIRWWDGVDLTAEDVAFSINRMIEPGEPRPRVGLLRPAVANAEAIDAKTVQINLKFPSASFLPFLAVDYMKIVPKHILEADIDINIFNNIVGSGPFRNDETRRGDSTSYTKNEDYFKDGRPFLDGMSMFGITDAGTAAAAFRGGNLQMTTAVSTLQVEDLLALEEDLADTHALYWQGASAGQHFFGNSEKAPWTDRRVITALRLATDLQEFHDAIGAGKYTLASPFPPGAWYARSREELLELPGYGGVDGSSRTKQQDIDLAIALLKEAGFDPPSELEPVEMTVPTTFIIPDASQLFAEQMRRNLGLKIDLKLVDVPTGVNKYSSGDFDMGSFGYGVNIFDPGDWVNAIYGPGSRNFTRSWNDDTLNGFIDAQASEQDIDKRREIIQNAQDYLMLEQQDPYITYTWVAFAYLVDNRIRTEVGNWVPAETIQVMLKNEHIWLAE